MGVPQLRLHGQPLRLRTRKTLALLVFLALEPGIHTRDELAELLWPTQPDTARASLRFSLHHLHAALSGALPLVLTPDGVELSRTSQLWVDALELDAQASDRANPPSPQGAELWQSGFLRGINLPDAPGWDDWAQAQAQHFSGRHDTLLARLAEAQLRAGHIWDALDTARRRVAHDLLNEDAYRQVSRVQRAAGQDSAAEATQLEYAGALRRELGVEPSPEPDSKPRPVPATRPVLTVQPQLSLVGRERELRLMDDAWARNQVIFLAGESGAGKTALAAAFLARHPEILAFMVEAQPTDAAIPYALQARSIRTAWTDLGRPEVPAEMARELSRIVAEFSSAQPVSLTTPQQKLRFFDAVIDFIAFVARAASPRQPMALSENLQWWDRESHAMGAYSAVNGPARGAISWAIITYRPELIQRDYIETILPVVNAGLAVIIDVLPLSVTQVHELLAQFEPQVSLDVAEGVHRYTSGNPLFVTETAKLLQARGGLIQADLKELPRSKRIRDTITERLSRLKPEVQAVARVAAVAGADFSFDLAARVLATDDLALAGAFETLESAGLFRGEGFAHDLLRDTAYDLTPSTARVVLHGRVLDAFQGRAASPASLSRHALEGRRWPEARELLLLASQDARDLLAHTEADAFAQQAAALPAG